MRSPRCRSCSRSCSLRWSASDSSPKCGASAVADGDLRNGAIGRAAAEFSSWIITLPAFRSIGRLTLLFAVYVAEQIRDPQLPLLGLAQKTQPLGDVRPHAFEEERWVVGAQRTRVVVTEPFRFSRFGE